MIRDIRTMSFQELAIFVEVVRCGGITAAADKLDLSKSVVSTQLNRLEDRLKVKLLTRSSRRVALTQEGEHLLPRVESLLEEGSQLFDQARHEAASPSGIVRIAATPDFGMVLAKDLFPKVINAYPNIQPLLKMGYEFEDLQDPTIDFAIRIGKVNDENLVAKKLGAFRRVLVASPECLEKWPIRTPDDVSKAPCLVFSSNSTQWSWTFQKKNNDNAKTSIGINACMGVQSFSALTLLVKQGEGFASIPEILINDDLQSGTLVEVLPEWEARPTNVLAVYRFGADKIQRIQAVLELVKTEIPKLLPRPPT